MVISNPFATNADYHSDALAEEQPADERQPAGEESPPEGETNAK